MKTMLAVATIALIAATYAFPVEESSWFDSAPATQLMQKDDAEPEYHRVEHSKNAAAANEEAAGKAADVEAKWEKKEENRTKKAKELSAEASKETAAFKKDLAEQQGKLKVDNAAALKKIADSEADTEEAEKKLKKANKVYNKYIEKINTAGKNADEASKKRAEEYEEGMKKLEKEISDEKANGEAIEKRMGENEKAHAKKIAKINSDYKEEEGKLAEEAKDMEEKFKEEDKKSDDHFNAEFKSNKDKAEAEEAKLAGEKKAADKEEADEKARIKTTYDAKAKAAAEAQTAYKKKTDDEAAALKAKRDETKKKFEDKAKADEVDYAKAMGHVAEKVKDYNKAAAAEKQAAATSAKLQGEREEQTKKDLAADAGIHGCKAWTQCQDAETQECKDLTDDGPYLADDNVHCSDTPGNHDTETDTEAVDDWMGGYAIGAEPTTAPAPEPTAKCLAAQKALPAYAHAAYAAYVEDNKVNPMQYMVCPPEDGGHFDGKVTRKEMKTAIEDVFGMLAICPPLCFPNSEKTVTNDVGSTMTDETCISPDDWSMFKMMIADLPVYKKSGTNGRFPAGESTGLCKMIHEFTKGLAAGAGNEGTLGA